MAVAVSGGQLSSTARNPVCRRYSRTGSSRRASRYWTSRQSAQSSTSVNTRRLPSAARRLGANASRCLAGLGWISTDVVSPTTGQTVPDASVFSSSPRNTQRCGATAGRRSTRTEAPTGRGCDSYAVSPAVSGCGETRSVPPGAPAARRNARVACVSSPGAVALAAFALRSSCSRLMPASSKRSRAAS